LVGSQQSAGGRDGNTQAPGGKVGDMSDPHVAEGSSIGIHPARGIQSGTLVEEEEWYKYTCLIKEDPTPDDL